MTKSIHPPSWTGRERGDSSRERRRAADWPETAAAGDSAAETAPDWGVFDPLLSGVLASSALMLDASDNLDTRARLERALSLIADELARVSDVPKLLRQALAVSAELLGAEAGVVAFSAHVEAPLVRAASWEQRAKRGCGASDASPALQLAD